MKRDRDAVAGFSYRMTLWAAVMVGAVSGVILFATFGIPTTGTVVDGDPLSMQAIFRSAPSGMIVTVVAGMIIGAIPWLFPTGDSRTQFAVLSAGAGFLIGGLWMQWTQKIQIRPTEFSVRNPGSLWMKSYPLGGGNRVRMQIEQRPFSRHGNRHSIHFDHADGTSEELCHDTRYRPLWNRAVPHLIRAAPAGQVPAGR